MTTVIEKNVSEMTTKELEQLLHAKKKEEAQKLAKEKEQYETERDADIENLIQEAAEVGGAVARLKQRAHEVMNRQSEKLSEYGGIRSNSKGGFSITNRVGDKRITRRRDTDPVWDERATKGVELIKDFLFDTVKKRDLNLFEILLSFLERNEKGDLEFSKVFSLLQHEARYSDERWKEGLRLLKDSYSVQLKGFGYEFRVKGEDGKWDKIELNFSSI